MTESQSSRVLSLKVPSHTLQDRLESHTHSLVGPPKIQTSTMIGVPYWTDGAILAESGSIPTCVFGPGDIRIANSPDEFVNLEDLLRVGEIYASVAQRFCA